MGKKKARDFADLPDYEEEGATAAAAPSEATEPDNAGAQPAAGSKKAAGKKGKKGGKKGAKGFDDSDEDEGTVATLPVAADSDEEFSSKPKPGACHTRATATGLLSTPCCPLCSARVADLHKLVTCILHVHPSQLATCISVCTCRQGQEGQEGWGSRVCGFGPGRR